MIDDSSFTANSEPSYWLYTRLSHLIDRNIAKLSYRGCRMNMVNRITTCLDFLQQGVIGDSLNKFVHTSAAILIFSDSKNKFENDDVHSMPLEDFSLTAEMLEQRVAELLEDPTKAHQYITVERYDVLQKAYQKRIEYLNDILTEYFTENPEKIQEIFAEKKLI